MVKADEGIYSLLFSLKEVEGIKYTLNLDKSKSKLAYKGVNL